MGSVWLTSVLFNSCGVLAEVASWVHIPEVEGSSPSPATIVTSQHDNLTVIKTDNPTCRRRLLKDM